MSNVTKICRISGKEFVITEADQAFYAQLDVPIPTVCPQERYRLRIGWRNERNYYLRKCNGTGEQVVSIFSPDKAWPLVYSQEYWWSDKWDPLSYGRDYDFTRSFFEQFGELYTKVPQIAMQNSGSENCEYTNQSQNNKNCYLLTCSDQCEDCYYGMWCEFSKDCLDCLYLERSELCYEILNGRECYECMFSENIQNCNNCYFCKNCIGCRDCFGSVNLRNKQYYFFNEQLSEIEYKKRLKAMDLDSRKFLDAIGARFEEHARQFPHKYYKGSNTENSSGDYISNVRNTLESYNCRHDENVKFCTDVWRANNCYDLTETIENEFCLQLEGCAYNSYDMFSQKLCYTGEVYYSSHCYHSKNLFGCIGLRNKQYCILNKQYTKEEYASLLPRIIEYMKQTKEWGEYLPIKYSPYGYNETVAQEYFPLTKEQALAQGLQWKDDDSKNYAPATCEIIDRSKDISDSILHEVLACSDCRKNYRIIKKELDFYRMLNLPLPQKCFECRHMKRANMRNPRCLRNENCMKCSKDIVTNYPENTPDMVYCEECYLQSVT